MAKELTDGFDLKAKVAEGFLSSVASGPLRPPRHTKTVQWLDQNHLLEVYFHQRVPPAPVLGTGWATGEGFVFPYLRLLPAQGNLSRVQLRFPFRAIVRKLGFEKTAEARAVVATKVVSETDGQGKIVAQINVDLSNLTAGDFDFHPDLGSITWHDEDKLDGSEKPIWLEWKAHTRFPQALFEQEVEPLVIDALRTIKDKPITPPTRSLEYVTFRTYADAARFLGVFANTTTDTSSFPAAPLTFSMPPLAFNEPAATNIHVLVPVETVMPILEAEKATAVTKAQDDYGVEIEDFKLELQNGYVLAAGRAEKDNVDVDFEAELGLSIHNGILSTHEIGLNVDLPWWLDFLQYVPVGAVIVEAVRKAVITALGEAVENSSSAAFNLSIFSEQVEEPATVFATYVADGPITIRATGLVIPGRITATGLGSGPIELPPRAFAHRRSKEFHHADCGQFHMKLWGKNVVVFPNEAAALQQGFNGCVHCHPEYHLEDLDYGYVKVRVRLTDPVASDLEVGLWLELIGPLSVHDVTVMPSSRLSAHQKFLPSPGAHVMAVPLDVFGGTWKLQITRGEWSTQCVVEVPPRKGHKYVRVTIAVGAAECDVDELAIPTDTPMAVGKLRL